MHALKYGKQQDLKSARLQKVTVSKESESLAGLHDARQNDWNKAHDEHMRAEKQARALSDKIEAVEKGHDKMAMRVVEAERQLTWWTFGNYGVARIRKSLMKHLHLSRLDLVNNQVLNKPPLTTASICALSPTPLATHTPIVYTISRWQRRPHVFPVFPAFRSFALLTPPLPAHTSSANSHLLRLLAPPSPNHTSFAKSHLLPSIALLRASHTLRTRFTHAPLHPHTPPTRSIPRSRTPGRRTSRRRSCSTSTSCR